MKKFICTICGYVHEGETAPEFCPQCKAPASKFQEQSTQTMSWADEHRIGVAAGVDAEVYEGLQQNFMGECTEVGMYLAMARQAHREAILRSVCTTRKPLTRRQSMLLSLPSCWAK